MFVHKSYLPAIGRLRRLRFLNERLLIAQIILYIIVQFMPTTCMRRIHSNGSLYQRNVPFHSYAVTTRMQTIYAYTRCEYLLMAIEHSFYVWMCLYVVRTSIKYNTCRDGSATVLDDYFIFISDFTRFSYDAIGRFHFMAEEMNFVEYVGLSLHCPFQMHNHIIHLSSDADLLYGVWCVFSVFIIILLLFILIFV